MAQSIAENAYRKTVSDYCVERLGLSDIRDSIALAVLSPCKGTCSTDHNSHHRWLNGQLIAEKGVRHAASHSHAEYRRDLVAVGVAETDPQQ